VSAERSAFASPSSTTPGPNFPLGPATIAQEDVHVKMVGEAMTSGFRLAVPFAVLWWSLATTAAAQPAKVEAYRLSPTETASLARFVSQSTHDLMHGAASLQRVFKNVAAGVRLGRTPFLRMFDQGLGNPDDVEVEEERFLFASGCVPRSCPEKAAFIVDLVSGHVVMALYVNGLRVAHKNCANAELMAFAERRLATWRGGGPRETPLPLSQLAEIHTTPCRATAPAKPGR
jgi:hypothetical protein